MAYYIRKGLVEENIETLEMIYRVIRDGREQAFKAPSPSKMNSIRHQFRKLLAAADRLPHEAGGKYKGLAASTEISLDWDSMRVIVRPKDSAPEYTPVLPGEEDMLELVKSYTGQVCQLKGFVPPDDLDAFDHKLQQLGFRLARDVNTGEYAQISEDEELGTVLMLAERIEQKPKRPSIYEQFGFTRGPDS